MHTLKITRSHSRWAIITAALVISLAGCGSSQVTITSFGPLDTSGTCSAGKGVGVAVEVYNPGNRPLTYKWTATRGNVRVSSPSVPAGTYECSGPAGVETITVQVMSDGQEVAQKSFPIEVGPVLSGQAATTPSVSSAPTSILPAETSRPPTEISMPLATPANRPVTTTTLPTEAPTVLHTSPGPTTPVASQPAGTQSSQRPVIASLEPKPEDCGPQSPCTVVVQGTWLGADAHGTSKLYVLVRPIPDDPRQSYWVQGSPQDTDDQGHWSLTNVYIGQVGDPAGLPFRICVVATDQPLLISQQLGQPPSGPIACINVTRGRA